MEATGTEIRILLVDDHAMFRQSLARLLEKEMGFKVAGHFGSAAEALAALNESNPTMILLDIDLGPERALDFVLESKKRGFKGQILVVTVGTTGQEAVQLVQAGVAGILHKHHSTDELCDKIRQIAAGEVYRKSIFLLCIGQSVEPKRIIACSPSGIK